MISPVVLLKSQVIEDLKLPESEYAEAYQFIAEEHWMYDSLNYWGIDPDFAVAIVFPEILRYSSVRNWAETHALEVLYVQYGKDYADFSIGYFQMKPGFIEHLESDYNKSAFTNKKLFKDLTVFSIDDESKIRYQRLERIKDLHWQLRYLVIFCRLMEEKYPEYNSSSIKEKLRFYATAYNTGYFKAKTTIIARQSCNDFYTTILKPKECLNYSKVAEYGLERLLKSKK